MWIFKYLMFCFLSICCSVQQQQKISHWIWETIIEQFTVEIAMVFNAASFNGIYNLEINHYLFSQIHVEWPMFALWFSSVYVLSFFFFLNFEYLSMNIKAARLNWIDYAWEQTWQNKIDSKTVLKMNAAELKNKFK